MKINNKELMIIHIQKREKTLSQQSLLRKRKLNKNRNTDIAGEMDSNLIWEGFQNLSISGE